MADSARVDRLLAVTRQSFRAPLEARERVRAGLAASGQQPGDAGGAAAGAGDGPKLAAVTGVARSTAALLSGLTFVAGFWLGGVTGEREPTPASRGQAAEVVPAARTAAAPAAVPSGDPGPVAASAGDPAAMASMDQHAPAVPRRAAAKASPRSERTSSERVPPREPRAARTRAATRDGTMEDPSRAARERRARTSGEELALLRRAEHAIRSGHPELALSLLDELDRRYPETRLDEERTAARLMARCARGDVDASASGARFLQSSPLSVYSDRVRALCAIEIVGDAPDGTDDTGH